MTWSGYEGKFTGCNPVEIGRAAEDRIAELERALLKITAIIETQSEPDIDAMHDVARKVLNK